MEASAHPFIEDVLLLLAAVLAFLPLSERLRIGTIPVYLAIGILVGPSGLSFLAPGPATQSLGELGVVFLLFSIGIEINPERLRLFGRGIYGLAVAKICATTAALAAVAVALGFALPTALIIGGALALSSTALVLQTLSERGLMASQLGRTTLAIVLIEDLAVAPMIIVISALGAGSHAMGSLIAAASLKLVLFCLAVFVAQRWLVRPLLRMAAGVDAPEVFTAATLFLLLGLAWVTHEIGLSLALGAFVAGLMVADTEYRHQIAGDIQPFRGLLLGLFFITVGMGLDLDYGSQHAETIAALLAVLMVVKIFVLFVLAKVFSVPTRRALALGGLLSQSSEFAFVLLALGVSAGALEDRAATLLTLVVGLSMVLTPLGVIIVDRLQHAGVAPRHSSLGDLNSEAGEISGHVVIAGFGQVGMAVTRYLSGGNVPVMVLDLSARRVTVSRSRGLPVFFGNAGRLDVLRATHLHRARALVITVPEPEDALQIVAVARKGFPGLPIFVRAPDDAWVDRLRDQGADAVVPEGMTTALDLAERVMVAFIPDSDVETTVDSGDSA